jgi:carboxymethylenebutenolidase
MTTNTAIPTLDGAGSIPAYVARPSSGTPRGAIIVIQEIFGVNSGIRRKTDAWAARGYLSVAPDVFWRQKVGLEFDADVPEQFQESVGYMMKHDFDLGIRDVEAIVHWIRREAGVPKVGLVGFCMGGRVAYMAATRTDVDASVGYYGVGIDQMLNESHAIAKALLLHVPTADGFVSPEAQKAMHAGLDDNPHVILYDYDGLDHGFAAEEGKRRNEEGARLADKRTEEFFAQHVG